MVVLFVTTLPRMVDHGKHNGGIIIMIDDEIRKRIEKNLPNHTDRTNFDIYFKECYKMVEEGMDFVVLSQSDPRVPCMVFSMDTGEFVGIEDPEYAREYGELL